MKKSLKITIWVAAALVVLIVVFGCTFQLREGECALIQRFGRIEAIYVRESTDYLRAQLEADGESDVRVYEGTGLKFKLPFMDNVIKYTSKLITYDTPSHQVITSDKKKIFFDCNAQWRILNPLRFYKGVNSVDTARSRIDNYLYSTMNKHVGTMESTSLITDKVLVNGMLEDLNNEVSDSCAPFGVDVFDIRIKRTDLPEENYQSIYNRMITERNSMASQYRSEGSEEALKIRSLTDTQVVVITSEAFRKAEILKGEGDSEAARVFNEAYGKNPGFFEFYNMLETYRQTIGQTSTLVIPLDSPFASYLLGGEKPFGTSSGLPSGTGAEGGGSQ